MPKRHHDGVRRHRGGAPRRRSSLPLLGAVALLVLLLRFFCVFLRRFPAAVGEPATAAGQEVPTAAAAGGGPITRRGQEVLPPTFHVAYLSRGPGGCEGIFAALVDLAVEHVNTRNSTLSATVGELSQDFRLRLLPPDLMSDHGGALGQLRSLYMREAKAVSAAGPPQPVALLSAGYSSFTMDAAEFVNVFGIPYLSSASTSPSLTVRQERRWPMIFRMLQSDAGFADVVTSIATASGWSHVFALAQQDDAWSEAITERLHLNGEKVARGGGFIVRSTRTLPSLTAEKALSVLEEVRRSGIRVVVQILNNYGDKYQLMTAAHRLRMVEWKWTNAGKTLEAWNYVWVHADVHGGFENYELLAGNLAVEARFAEPEKFAKLQELWPEAMQRRDLRALLPFHPVDRADLDPSKARCYGFGAFYDMVLAVAKGLDAMLQNNRPADLLLRGGVLPPGGAAGVEEDAVVVNAATQSVAKALAEALGTGVQVDGLLGPRNFKGKPWGEVAASWRIDMFRPDDDGAGEVKVRPVGTWSKDKGLLWEDDGRPPWPKEEEGKAPPGAFQQTVCGTTTGQDKDCGLGACQLSRAVARPPGWCKCPLGRLGTNCALYGLPGDPPGDPTPVELWMQLVEFGGFDIDGDSMVVELRLRLRWQDTRSILAAGDYEGSDVASLRKEGALWFPYLDYAAFEKHQVAEEGLTLDGRGSFAWTIQLRAETRVSSDYRGFPFDSQAGAVRLQALEPRKARLSAAPGNLLPVEGAAREGAGDDAIVSLGTRWSKLWSLQRAALIVEEGETETAGGAEEEEQDSNKAGSSSTSSSSVVFVLDIEVARGPDQIVWRYLVPSVVLTVVSWAGFFIKPAALMPRFASGFISFLALQSFKSQVQSQMPKRMYYLSTIDVYLSAVGLLMGYAVVETVLAQFIFEYFSPRVSKWLDQVCRLAFPCTYALVLLLTFGGSLDVGTLHPLVHLLILCMPLAILAWLVLALWRFPGVVIRTIVASALDPHQPHVRAGHGGNAADDHGHHVDPVGLNTKEAAMVFRAIDRDKSGSVSGREIFLFIQKHTKSSAAGGEAQPLLTEAASNQLLAALESAVGPDGVRTAAQLEHTIFETCYNSLRPFVIHPTAAQDPAAAAGLEKANPSKSTTAPPSRETPTESPGGGGGQKEAAPEEEEEEEKGEEKEEEAVGPDGLRSRNGTSSNRRTKGEAEEGGACVRL